MSSERRFLISDKNRSRYLILTELTKGQIIEGINALGNDLILIEDEPSVTPEDVARGYWREREVFNIGK